MTWRASQSVQPPTHPDVNIQRMLEDHAPDTIAGLDKEIDQLVQRIAKLVQQRSMIEMHMRLRNVFEPTEQEG